MARPTQELWVFLHGERVGVATRSRRGAVQFHPHPRLPEQRFESLVDLSDSDVSTMLRLIAQDGEDAPFEGLGELRLSLPGAQPKAALRLVDGRWCLPTGSLATTYILKPQRGHLNPSLPDQ